MMRLKTDANKRHKFTFDIDINLQIVMQIACFKIKIKTIKITKYLGLFLKNHAFSVGRISRSLEQVNQAARPVVRVHPVTRHNTLHDTRTFRF